MLAKSTLGEVLPISVSLLNSVEHDRIQTYFKSSFFYISFNVKVYLLLKKNWDDIFFEIINLVQ